MVEFLVSKDREVNMAESVKLSGLADQTVYLVWFHVLHKTIRPLADKVINVVRVLRGIIQLLASFQGSVMHLHVCFLRILPIDYMPRTWRC